MNFFAEQKRRLMGHVFLFESFLREKTCLFGKIFKRDGLDLLKSRLNFLNNLKR